MAIVRDRPFLNSNFLVDLGTGDGHAATAGFAEVIFPAFHIDSTHRHSTERAPPHSGDPVDAHASNRLILKRGLIGALDLYSWWSSAPRGKTPKRRTVKVMLLGEDHSTVVMTWVFRKAYPTTLSYSPLRATEGGVVMETVELAFDRMVMS